MSHNWIIIPLYCVGLLAEGAGGFGVYKAAFALRALRDTPFMRAGDGGTIEFNREPVEAIIAAQDQPIGSLVMLAIGIVAGFLGNLLSAVLPPSL